MAKEWLNEGLDSVEAVFNSLQDAYDKLPDRATALKSVGAAAKVVKDDMEGQYQCEFSRSVRALRRLSRDVEGNADAEKAFKKAERALSKNLRECFQSEYGDIL